MHYDCSLFWCQSYLNNQNELFFFLSLIRHYFGIWRGQADKVSLQRKLQEMNFQCLIKVSNHFI